MKTSFAGTLPREGCLPLGLSIMFLHLMIAPLSLEKYLVE